MLKRFIQYYRPHKKLLALDMSVAILAAILSVIFPYLTRTLLKQDIPSGVMQNVINTGLVMLGILVFKAICTYIRVRWGHIMGVNMEYDMRADIFHHLQKLSFNYYDNTKTGHIMSRISNDLNTISEVAHHAPEDLIISFVTIVGAFFVMFHFNAQLATIAIIPLPIMILWGIFYGGKMKSGFRNVRKRIADLNSNIENSVQGIREVKSYANEDLEINKFQSVNESFRLAKEKMYKVMATFFAGMFFLNDIYSLFVIVGGAVLIFYGKIDAADLISFTLFVSFILRPIQRLVNFVEQFQQGAASFERFIEVMDIEPDIQDKPNACVIDNLTGSIHIKNLSFRYKNPADLILDNITMEIPAGKSIAIVGESGAGKSTLVSLIPRFYEATKGSISLDNIDIMDIQKTFLRENIGLVQQNVFLFDTTIGENITYGKPDATKAELIEAARKANILSFIESLPDGFDTLVGERGVKLSGGQKQRVSIARVFLKNPTVLIFDEATSSLDTESEAYIQVAMQELCKNRTTIIIAHRLSTVKNADYIYVLKNGKLVENGTHDSLLAEQNYYYNLYTRNLI